MQAILLVVLASCAQISLSLRMKDLFRKQTHTARFAAVEEKLGWDSHKAIDSIPETLVRTIDGNDSMRRKFELLCRTAQVVIDDK